MAIYTVKSIKKKETGEEVGFSTADLNVDSSGSNKAWNIHLAVGENKEFFKKAIESNEELKLVFITEEEEDFEGKVRVSSKSEDNMGAFMDLVGIGELKKSH